MVYIPLVTVASLTLFLAYFMYNELMNIARKDRAVLISSGVKRISPIFKKIVKEFVPETDTVSFIELGAGYSKVTRLAARSFKWKTIVALELDWFPLLLAKLKNRLDKLPIEFIRGNVFDYEAPGGNGVIYGYMTTEILNRLYEENFFEGSLLISLTFGLKDVEPVYVEQIEGFQKRVIVYDFRDSESV